MALAGAGIAGNEHVLVAGDEAEVEEGLDGAAIELGLEEPIEGRECLLDLEAAALEAPIDAARELEAGGGGEQPLDALQFGGLRLAGPAQVGLEIEVAEAKPGQVPLALPPEFVLGDLGSGGGALLHGTGSWLG